MQRPSVNGQRVSESVELLEKFLPAQEIAPLLAVLKTLAQQPEDEKIQDQLQAVFDDLGKQQGAVLTYAPYVALILPRDPFQDID